MLFLEDLRQKAQWRYGRANWKTLLKTLVADGTAAMFWYRLMQWSQHWRLIPLTMVFNKINALFCQCIIGRGAEFGPGFVLNHSQGIVINGGVKGGSRIFLEHQVTLGAEKDGIPVLGDDVYVGAGAKIIGGVYVGSQTRVGANAVVVRHVPDGATVGGIPARVLKQRPIATSETVAKSEAAVGSHADVETTDVLDPAVHIFDDVVVLLQETEVLQEVPVFSDPGSVRGSLRATAHERENGRQAGAEVVR